MKLRYTDRLSLRLEGNTASVMAGLLHDGETEADFVRSGMRREIDARMTAIQRALAERGIETEIGDREARVAAYIASERAAGRVVGTDDASVREMLRVAEGKA